MVFSKNVEILKRTQVENRKELKNSLTQLENTWKIIISRAWPLEHWILGVEDDIAELEHWNKEYIW